MFIILRSAPLNIYTFFPGIFRSTGRALQGLDDKLVQYGRTPSKRCLLRTVLILGNKKKSIGVKSYCNWAVATLASCASSGTGTHGLGTQSGVDGSTVMMEHPGSGHLLSSMKGPFSKTFKNIHVVGNVNGLPWR